MSELVHSERPPRELGVRAQPTLRLAIGYRDEKKKGAPTKVDYFIAKPGAEGEYAAAAEKFTKVYGPKPKAIDVLLPASMGQALDIRYKAWASAGGDEGGILRAIGQTNFALEGQPEGPDVLTVWEPDGSVLEQEITGPTDPYAVELGLKMYTRLRFHIPNVLGLTGWAEISTTSAKSTDNLYVAISRLYGWFGPLVSELVRPKLVLRKAHARPIVVKGGQSKRIKSSFYALDLYVPDTIEEITAKLAERSELLPAPARRELPAGPGFPGTQPQTWQDGIEHAAIEAGLGDLPVPDEEGIRTAEEPSSFQRPDDALLNRIANLEEQTSEAIRHVLLEGAFGVESADQLSPEQAERYAEALAMEHEEAIEGEVVDA